MRRAIGVRAQKFQDRPLWIPSPTGIPGIPSPTEITLIYYPFGQRPSSPEGFGGLQRVLESLREPQRAVKGLRGLKGVLGASEGFRENLRASMSLWGPQWVSEGLNEPSKTPSFSLSHNLSQPKYCNPMVTQYIEVLQSYDSPNKLKCFNILKCFNLMKVTIGLQHFNILGYHKIAILQYIANYLFL